MTIWRKGSASTAGCREARPAVGGLAPCICSSLPEQSLDERVIWARDDTLSETALQHLLRRQVGPLGVWQANRGRGPRLHTVALPDVRHQDPLFHRSLSRNHR